jgi:glycosyltransferase involved in cell wall biosynthesis
MRVLLVSDFYPPQVGGMEQHVQSLARHLRTQGHAVFVATTEQEDRREVLDGIAVERFRGTAQRLSFAFSAGNRRYPPPFVDPELVAKFRGCIDRVRPDVVHVHGWTMYSVLAASARCHFPIVVTLHDYGHFCPKKTLLRGAATCEEGRGTRCLTCALREYGAVKSLVTFVGTGLGLRQTPRVDAFIAVSQYVRERSVPYLGDQPIYVIPNFLDPADLAAEHVPSLRDQLPKRYLAFVGVLAPFKGVDDLLRAFRTARDRSPGLASVELLLLGRADPTHRYESDPAAGIRVVTNPPRGLVVAAIAACHGLVVPSRWPEPCPTVVLEAVAAGRPIIGTRLGGIPDLLEGVPGARLIPAGCPGTLASSIEDMCALAGEATPVAQWVAPAGYRALQPARVVTEIVSVYRQALARRGTLSGITHA